MIKELFQTSKEIFDKTKKNITNLKKEDSKEVFSMPEINDGDKCNHKNDHNVNISSSSIAKATLTILGIGLISYFLYSIGHLLILFFISLFFAASLDPAVDFLEKHKIPRTLGVLLLFLFFLIFLIFFVGSIVPIMIDQISSIISSIGSSMIIFFNKLQEGQIVIPYIGEAMNGSVAQAFQSINIDNVIKTIFENFAGYVKEIKSIAKGGVLAAGEVVSTGASIVGAIGGFLFDLILVLFLTFFLVIDRSNLNNFFRSLFPPKNAEYIQQKTHSIQVKIGGWVRGQFALMGLMFIFSLIGLFIIGMGEYALTLSMIIGIGEILPYIGPIMFLLIALPIAFNLGLFVVVKLLILYGILQFIEGNILVPAVMNKAVGLNPIVILLVILIGFQFLGVIGAILAVPATTAISIFIKDYIEFQQSKLKK